MPQPLIILGTSARAAAQSAIRAGYEPWCVDLSASRDLQRIATVHACPPEQYPSALLRLLDAAPPDAPVLLTAAMENHPDLVEAIGFDRSLLGSSAQAIRRVRHPLALPSLPAAKGLKFCRTRTSSSLAHRMSRLIFGVWGGVKYLRKPQASAGGAGISWWHPGQLVGRGHYLQQYVRGTPYSAVFTADGWSAQLLGVTEQLVGEFAFGAGEFAYCGSIGPSPVSSSMRAALAHLGVQLTQRYDVRGIFGVDLVMDFRGNLWPIEVNPRYVSSIEILERAHRVALLSPLGALGEKARTKPTQVHGKAVVFAKREVTVGDLDDLLPADQLADVPEPGRTISVGQPVCTVFAAAPSRDACFATLRERAAAVYQQIERR